MKKISVLLAVIMIFSCVTVCAAPVADYVFYDEDAGSYFVYGRYLNSTAGARNLHATEAGVYVNGEKYVYGGEDAYVTEEGEDGPVDVSYLELANRMDVPKFAIQFKAPKDYFDGFKVQPYIVNKTGEIKGDAINYDVATGKRILSDNADLKYINFERGNGKTQFMMYPSFDPEVRQYTVKGYGTTAVTTGTLTYGVADSRATASHTSNGAVTTIKVVAENGAEKEYIITFVSDTGTATGPNPTAIAGIYNQTPTNTTSLSANGNGQMDMQYYPASAEKKFFVMTFPITEAMKSKTNFAVSFISSMANDNIYSDYVISAKKVTLADEYAIQTGKTCYKDVNDGFLTIDEEVGKTIVKGIAKSAVVRNSVDVTKAVTDAIAAGDTEFSIALSIDSCTVPAGELSPNNILFRVYISNGTVARNIQLIY